MACASAISMLVLSHKSKHCYIDFFASFCFGSFNACCKGGLDILLSVGGSNIPAVNDLLSVFGISFGDALLEGQMTIGDEKIYYASGVNIVRFPAKGVLHAYLLSDKATAGEKIASTSLEKCSIVSLGHSFLLAKLMAAFNKLTCTAFKLALILQLCDN